MEERNARKLLSSLTRVLKAQGLSWIINNEARLHNVMEEISEKAEVIVSFIIPSSLTAEMKTRFP